MANYIKYNLQAFHSVVGCTYCKFDLCFWFRKLCIMFLVSGATLKFNWSCDNRICFKHATRSYINSEATMHKYSCKSTLLKVKETVWKGKFFYFPCL